ncbi:hypothetical protein MMC10_005629 [Thelotrema lepadinum]|nr:hypothetical protein [Thelotrema lepadinum]
MSKAQGVHLVGSIPFDSEKAVFTKVFEALPGKLATVPDGECNSRENFVMWQKFAFPKDMHGQFFADYDPPGVTYPKDLNSIPPTRYDQVAISSYETFKKFRADGTIPPNVRFQVSLPGPSNVVYAQVQLKYQNEAMVPYEKQFLQDVQEIAKSIPHEDLAVQIDVAIEVGFIEFDRGNHNNTFLSAQFPDVQETVLQGLLKLAKVFPSSVQLGFHLCYGDIEHQHFMQPKDLGLCVELANDLVKGLKPFRTVNWIHMPVPADRKDGDYYAPLKSLDIGGAKLFLGLVHPRDQKGTEERIATAKSIYSGQFGVATECGMGRTPLGDIDSILAISNSVTDPVDDTKTSESELISAFSSQSLS